MIPAAAPMTAHELSQLHDIHLPEVIPAWELAPGWYALILTAVLLFMFVYSRIRATRAFSQARHQALKELDQLKTEHQQSPNSQRSTAHVSELLKRVALAYFSREQVAALQGDVWIRFLNETAKKLDFNQVRTELLTYPYQPPQPCDLTLFFHLSQQWIDCQGRKRANKRGQRCSS